MPDDKNPGPVNSMLARLERRKNLTQSHRRAPKMESELAKAVKGRVTPGSGNGAVKGDIRIKGIARIECKCTKNKSFSVNLEMIEKIEAAAAEGGELPIIVIEFIDDAGRKIKQVAVCPMYVLDSLKE